jgi:hypothetical protein
MNTKPQVFDTTLRRVVGDSAHQLAQNWGLNFIRYFLKTGMKVEEAYQAELAAYTLEHRNHLTHCWENDRCHEIRELVDATNLYCLEDYLYYCRRELEKLDIMLNPVEQEQLVHVGVTESS